MGLSFATAVTVTGTDTVVPDGSTVNVRVCAPDAFTVPLGMVTDTVVAPAVTVPVPTTRSPSFADTAVLGSCGLTRAPVASSSMSRVSGASAPEMGWPSVRLDAVPSVRAVAPVTDTPRLV